jgi:DNA-binding NtrC family response regulator
MPAPTILIADDDSSFRRVLEYQEKQAGYDVLTAEDGKQALEIFSQNRCHAVLTDLDMPELSGNELLKSIKQQSPDTPVIVITAYGTIDSAVEARKTHTPAAGVFPSPWSFHDWPWSGSSLIQNIF